MSSQGVWYFEDVNMYKVFCPHLFREYEDKHDFKNFKKDEFIYFKDDPSNNIYMVAEGKVKIAYYTDGGKEVVKSILSKGEIFGEMALMGEEKRNDFARSIEQQTLLCPLNIEVMHDLMYKNRSLSFKIYKLIGFRFRKMERKIEGLINKDVKTRLVDFILDMANEYGQKVGDETLIRHAFTQKDIADLIGASRQTVTTLLNDFKEANLIYFDRKRILVRNLDQFKEQADALMQ